MLDSIVLTWEPYQCGKKIMHHVVFKLPQNFYGDMLGYYVPEMQQHIHLSHEHPRIE